MLMLLMLSTVEPVHASESLPTGSLRAVCLATNLVQARVDRVTGEMGGKVLGPAAELAQAIARELGLPLALRAVPGTADVSAEVSAGGADLGFLAFDQARRPAGCGSGACAFVGIRRLRLWYNPRPPSRVFQIGY